MERGEMRRKGEEERGIGGQEEREGEGIGE